MSIALPILLALASQGGCRSSGCEGLACERSYTASRVGVFLGKTSGWPAAMDALDDADAIYQGAETDGIGWTAVALPGMLFIGMPAASRVVRFDWETLGPGLPLPSIEVSWTYEAADTRFGAALAASADLTGDGAADLVAGAPAASGALDAREAGSATVLQGAATSEGVITTPGEDSLQILGATPSDLLGTTVATCGDMDLDGVQDLAIAAPWYEDGDHLQGAVWLALSSTWLETAGWGPLSTNDLGAPYTLHQDGARVGDALTCTSDFSGDGIPDLAVGAPFADDPSAGLEAAGAVFLVDAALHPDGGDLEQVATWRLSGSTAEAYLGASVATDDLDEDGIADVLAGSPGASGGAGEAVLFSSIRPGTLSTARFRGEDAGDRLGTQVALADVTGDGHADLLVGAPRSAASGRTSEFAAGAVHVWYDGHDYTANGKTWEAERSDTRFASPSAWLETGRTFTTADLDGDGTSDLVLVHRSKPVD